MPSDLQRCRVCGLLQDEPPWGDDGLVPSFEICPCCGAEFGYEDVSLNPVMRKRRQWLEAGAKWTMPRFKPPAWNLPRQLDDIPSDFKGTEPGEHGEY